MTFHIISFTWFWRQPCEWWIQVDMWNAILHCSHNLYVRLNNLNLHGKMIIGWTEKTFKYLNLVPELVPNESVAWHYVVQELPEIHWNLLLLFSRGQHSNGYDDFLLERFKNANLGNFGLTQSLTWPPCAQILSWGWNPLQPLSLRRPTPFWMRRKIL